LVAPIIYEDCKACIDLVSGAKGQIWTKQMQRRIFRTKDFLDEKKGTIVFVNTENQGSIQHLQASSWGNQH
jgi:hypothetical protein